MARFKDFPHGRNGHFGEKVAHIRPSHWNRRLQGIKQQGGVQPQGRSAVEEQEAGQEHVVDPVLVEPRVLVASPLVSLYESFKSGCSHLL